MVWRANFVARDRTVDVQYPKRKCIVADGSRNIALGGLSTCVCSRLKELEEEVERVAIVTECMKVVAEVTPHQLKLALACLMARFLQVQSYRSKLKDLSTPAVLIFPPFFPAFAHRRQLPIEVDPASKPLEHFRFRSQRGSSRERHRIHENRVNVFCFCRIRQITNRTSIDGLLLIPCITGPFTSPSGIDPILYWYM